MTVQSFIDGTMNLHKEKPFIIVSRKDGKYILVDIRNTRLNVVGENSIKQGFNQISNVKSENGEIVTTDISKTRLKSILDRENLYYAYVMTRQRDSKGEDNAYVLMLINLTTNQVKIESFHKSEAIKLFEKATVLNAKLVTRQGVEIISGIQHEIPEIVEKEDKVAPISFTKEDGEHEINLQTKMYHLNYLKRLDNMYSSHFMAFGYATTYTGKKEEVKQLKRFVAEVVMKSMPELREYASNIKTPQDYAMLIDIYYANNHLKGRIDTNNLYVPKNFWVNTISKLNKSTDVHMHVKASHLKNSSILFLVSPTSEIGVTGEFKQEDVYNGQSVIIVTDNKSTVSTVPTNELKDFEAIKQGVSIGEVKLYAPKATLINLHNPIIKAVNEEVIQLLKLRDMMLINQGIQIKNSTEYGNITNTKITRFLNNLENKLNLLTRLPKLFMRGNQTSINKYFESKHTLNVSNIDWSTAEAFIYMNVKPLPSMNRDRNYEGRYDFFYNIPDNYNSSLHLAKGAIRKYYNLDGCINYVGDAILVNALIGEETISGSKIPQHILIRLFALLYGGNKTLALELDEQLGYKYATDRFDIPNINLSKNLTYQTGGRIGDIYDSIPLSEKTEKAVFKYVGEISSDLRNQLLTIITAIVNAKYDGDMSLPTNFKTIYN